MSNGHCVIGLQADECLRKGCVYWSQELRICTWSPMKLTAKQRELRARRAREELAAKLAAQGGADG